MLKLFKNMRGVALVFCILAPLFMVLEVMMDLMQPTTMANIINVGVANLDLDYVTSEGFKMMLYAFIGLIGGAGCSICASVAGTLLGRNIRGALFNKIQGMSFAEIDRFKAGSLITRLTNDTMQIQNVTTMGLKLMVRAPFLCIGGVVMACTLSIDLAVILLFAVPIVFLVLIVVMKGAFPLFRKMQQKVDNVNNVVRENLQGVRVVKSFNMEDDQKRRFDAANADLLDNSVKSANRVMTLMPIINFVVNASVIAVFWYGGFLAGTNNDLAGNISAFVMYLTQILGSLMTVVMMGMTITRAKAAADRINEVMDSESSIKEKEQTVSPTTFEMAFNNVSFRYYDTGEEYALKNLNFTIAAGEKIGVIGSTGSGKSTMIALMARLYDVTDGAITIGGVDVRDMSLKELRKNVGIVLQEKILLSGSVRDNIKYADGTMSDEEMQKAAKAAMAEPFITEMGDNYDHFVEQQGRNFSGGQKQRLSIARTLAMRPKVLIFDDATSALDTKTEKELFENMGEYVDGNTFILVAQRISSVMNMDRIMVLDGGEITGFGTHSELLRTNETYREIAVSQLGEGVLENV